MSKNQSTDSQNGPSVPESDIGSGSLCKRKKVQRKRAQDLMCKARQPPDTEDDTLFDGGSKAFMNSPMANPWAALHAR